MNKKNYLKSIGFVMIIMLSGKLLSLVANLFYMSHFGPDNEYINIYSWAIQIPNYIFQSLGTAVSSVIIPIFAALVAQNKHNEAKHFGSNIITISSLFTFVFIIAGIAVSGLLPSFTEFSDKAYATMAIRIMMPVMLFYCLSFIYQGILQSLDNFVVPALVNLPSGILIIIYVIFFADHYGVKGLLVTTFIGLFVQYAILILPTHKAGFKYKPLIDFKDNNIITAGKMMVPIIIGAGAYQLNMFLNNTMMTNVSPKSVTLFNFVQTLIISSVMTLILAITSVMYPALTSFAAKEDIKGFKDTLSSTMSALIFILLPITVGLIFLRTPFLSLVSQHGKVNAANIKTEADFLLMYSLCIVFLGLKEIIDRAFYSLKTTKISAVTGIIIMVINVILGYILSGYTPLKANGIPFAYSIASILGTIFLIVMLRHKIGPYGGGIPLTTLKSAIASALMGVSLYVSTKILYDFNLSSVILTRLFKLLIPALIAVIVYFITAFILKINPLMQFLGQLKNRKATQNEDTVSY